MDMEHRANLEIIAPSKDEAIRKGLEQLGLSRDQVDIEVLDEGSGGLFGLGGRQARVRLTVKPADGAAPPAKPTPARPAQPAAAGAPVDTENLVSITQATVEELLSHMDVRAQVSAYMGEAEGDEPEAPVMVDITGGDLSFLIGRQAETLQALQLITRLIVGKEVGHAAHIIIDVENYRKRREDSLRQLAQRMAQQAVSSGRRQNLEPMSPAERRIIHIALRDNPEVTTESTGEEPRRKVVIVPRS
ncbi:MAG: Jag N-terminal domain-containing protein [Anaerolineales bacterium]|nr:Jag N-terminal domain-containing protein [Anaerolineales bacterium]